MNSSNRVGVPLDGTLDVPYISRRHETYPKIRTEVRRTCELDRVRPTRIIYRLTRYCLRSYFSMAHQNTPYQMLDDTLMLYLEYTLVTEGCQIGLN